MRAFWNKIGKTGISEVSPSQKKISEPISQIVPVSRLSAEELCCKYDPQCFDFLTTSDIPVKKKLIGQDRALRSIEFGIKIKSNGFNLFVAGLAGTGKDRAILEIVTNVAQSEPVPDDICFVFNFKSPLSPNVICFPAGCAKQFKIEIDELVMNVQAKIKEAFSSEQYERNCHKIENILQNEKDLLDRQLKIFAESKRCDIRQQYKGNSVQPMVGGKLITDREFEGLPQTKQDEYMNARQEVHDKIFDKNRTVRLRQRQINNEVCETDKKLISELLENMFMAMELKYRDIDGISTYLSGLREDFLKDIELYKTCDSADELDLFTMQKAIPDKYVVNVFVDNSVTVGAPIIVERNPSFSNLFGSIQYRMQNGAIAADHLSLMAGSVHRARGGYLIIEIEEILGDLQAWNALKKLLRHGEIRVENNSEHIGIVPAIGLRPEPISTNLKVVLTGDPAFYQTLYIHDDEFVRLFKVKADFVEQISKSEEVINDFVSFIARICDEEGLKPCDRFAVAKVIDYSSRIVDHKQRISAQLTKISDLLREANYHAIKQCSSCITEDHIRAACEELRCRCCTYEDKMLSLIEDSTVLITTSGYEVGQINGVSIINTGDYAFGVPSRITAKTFIGSGNIINIEREAEMSGKVHAKGVLILGGYLGQTYAQDKPLALSASICFEQHYEEIDGDSASSAELYCLMSSLSGVKIRQDIAVTGSVDQRGRIQPVGGINTKIEGFFKACFIKGLTGTQGMVIPEANVKNLMLNDEILEAVSHNMFHIYAVSTIEQGLQILTNKDPGLVMEDGSFQPGTIHFLVNQKLRDYASVVASYEKEKDQYI